MAKKKSTETQEAAKPAKDVIKTVADNRRVRHEFEVLETIETGIELAGTEVKSMRKGLANLQDSFAKIEEGEVFLYHCHISPYDHGNRFNHEPNRKRRLLLHKAEIRKLKSKVQEKGLALVPLKMYFKGNWAKVSLGLCKGKRIYDKRDTITKRDVQRDVDRAIKGRYR